MAYTFDLERDFDRTPFCDAFGHESITFALGENDEAQIAVLMTVRLMRKEEGIYSIVFGIEERDATNNFQSFGLDFSREYSKRYIPKEFRPAVLEMILEALTCILDKINPRKVIGQSFYKCLPDKALKKYEKISALMRDRGYQIEEIVPIGNNDVRFWFYERLPIADRSDTLTALAEEN